MCKVLHEGHLPVFAKPGAEGRAVHACHSCRFFQGDGAPKVAHHKGADSLHALHVSFDAHGPSGKGVIRGCEKFAKKQQHGTQALKLVEWPHALKAFLEHKSASSGKAQGIVREGDVGKPVAHLGKGYHAAFHKGVLEGDHEEVDVTALVCRIRGKLLGRVDKIKNQPI